MPKDEYKMSKDTGKKETAGEVNTGQGKQSVREEIDALTGMIDSALEQLNRAAKETGTGRRPKRLSSLVDDLFRAENEAREAVERGNESEMSENRASSETGGRNGTCGSSETGGNSGTDGSSKTGENGTGRKAQAGQETQADPEQRIEQKSEEEQADGGEIDYSDEDIDARIDKILEELNGMIGLTSVKQEVVSLVNIQKINVRRKRLGMKEAEVSRHLVFSGNPGTGKTTVARILAKVYHELGILGGGQLIEVDRSGLVAGYIGQTAIKTSEVIKKAMGGVLFIDEAYTLSAGKGESDYGQEAIDTILKAMEDKREDFIVIVAGYTQLMQEFLDSNPGLRSRFNKVIEFPDYTPEELEKIFAFTAEKNGYRAAEDAQRYVKDYYRSVTARKEPNFANARDVRNLFEKAVTRQANRLAGKEKPGQEEQEKKELELLTLADVSGVDISVPQRDAETAEKSGESAAASSETAATSSVEELTKETGRKTACTAAAENAEAEVKTADITETAENTEIEKSIENIGTVETGETAEIEETTEIAETAEIAEEA